jgi:hypothetical protein
VITRESLRAIASSTLSRAQRVALINSATRHEAQRPGDVSST